MHVRAWRTSKSVLPCVFSLWRLLIPSCLLAFSACAPKLAALPSGPGTPFRDYAAAYSEATHSCRDRRTFVGLLALSGRAGDTKLRGRIEAGFAEPAQARLELPAPGGRPFFILVARGDDTTLLFPRDRRVLRDAPTEAVLEALAGVALGADELRAVVTGCGLGAVSPTGGRAYDNGWVAIEADTTTTWLRRVDGEWRVMATERGPLQIRYQDHRLGYPSTIRIRAVPETAGSAAADLTVRVSQAEFNTSLGSEVFEVSIPPDAVPLTLEEFRRAGPLGSGNERQ